jgi:hypothetical protein
LLASFVRDEGVGSSNLLIPTIINNGLPKFDKPIIFETNIYLINYKILTYPAYISSWAHNPKVVSSNLAPATKLNKGLAH